MSLNDPIVSWGCRAYRRKLFEIALPNQHQLAAQESGNAAPHPVSVAAQICRLGYRQAGVQAAAAARRPRLASSCLLVGDAALSRIQDRGTDYPMTSNSSGVPVLQFGAAHYGCEPGHILRHRVAERPRSCEPKLKRRALSNVKLIIP
eukprot:SAG31_NODE_2479_length_5631_cov_99.073325_4_plen_148_part_00